MHSAMQLSETTLKPLPDKWIAQDGVAVLLRADRHSAMLLRYRGTEWIISEHRAVGSATPPANRFAWRGRLYSIDGHPLFAFCESDSHEVWEALYRRIFAVVGGGPGGFKTFPPDVGDEHTEFLSASGV